MARFKNNNLVLRNGQQIQIGSEYVDEIKTSVTGTSDHAIIPESGIVEYVGNSISLNSSNIPFPLRGFQYGANAAKATFGLKDRPYAVENASLLKSSAPSGGTDCALCAIGDELFLVAYFNLGLNEAAYTIYDTNGVFLPEESLGASTFGVADACALSNGTFVIIHKLTGSGIGFTIRKLNGQHVKTFQTIEENGYIRCCSLSTGGFATLVSYNTGTGTRLDIWDSEGNLLHSAQVSAEDFVYDELVLCETVNSTIALVTRNTPSGKRLFNYSFQGELLDAQTITTSTFSTTAILPLTNSMIGIVRRTSGTIYLDIYDSRGGAAFIEDLILLTGTGGILNGCVLPNGHFIIFFKEGNDVKFAEFTHLGEQIGSSVTVKVGTDSSWNIPRGCIDISNDGRVYALYSHTPDDEIYLATLAPTVLQHNEFPDLQGGDSTAGQFYHMDENLYNRLSADSDTVYISDNLDVSAKAAFGSLASISPVGVLTVNEEFNGTYGLGLIIQTDNQNSNAANWLYGANIIAQLDQATVHNTVIGANFLANVTPNGATVTDIIGISGNGSIVSDNSTITNIVGGDFVATSAFSEVNVNITNLAAVRANALRTGSGEVNITNAYGVLIQDPGFNTTGVGENLYGLYVEDQTGSNFNNEYNIYSAGENSLNQFEGNVQIGGDLVVDGTTFVVHNQEVTTADNLVILNYGEVGAGVTAGLSGIEIDRGSLTNYQFVFVEASDTFRVGEIGSLQPVATREDTPVDGSFAYWNDSEKRFDTVNSLLFVDSTGITVAGDIHCNDLYTSGNTIHIGTSQIKSIAGDLEFYHTGAFNAYSNDVLLMSLNGVEPDQFVVGDIDTGTYYLIYSYTNGDFTIYNDNNITFELQGGSGSVSLGNYNPDKAHLEIVNTASVATTRFRLAFGSSYPFEFYADRADFDLPLNISNINVNNLEGLDSTTVNVIGDLNVTDDLYVSGNSIYVGTGQIKSSGSENITLGTDTDYISVTPGATPNVTLSIDDSDSYATLFDNGTKSFELGLNGDNVGFYMYDDGYVYIGSDDPSHSVSLQFTGVGSAGGLGNNANDHTAIKWTSDMEIVTVGYEGGTNMAINETTDTIAFEANNVTEGTISTSGLSLKSGIPVNAILNENDMSSDSTSALATQASIKAFVEARTGAGTTPTYMYYADVEGNITATEHMTYDDIDGVILEYSSGSAYIAIEDMSINIGADDTIALDSVGSVEIESNSATEKIWMGVFGNNNIQFITGGATIQMTIDANGIALNSGVPVNSILDENDMASDSTSALATQASIKTYVDQLRYDIFDSTSVVITGDIYCNDIHTSGNTIYVGDAQIKSTGGNVGLSFGDTIVAETTAYGLQNPLNATFIKSKTGWAYDAKDTLEFSTDSTSRNFILSDTGGSFEFWVQGVKFTKTGEDSVIFDDIEGEWYIFYNTSGVLTASQTPWDISAENAALVANLYWDADNKEVIYVGQELHSYAMPSITHYHMHETIGTLYEEGFGITNNGNGSLDISGGQLHDEDIRIITTDNLGSGWFDQILSPARMPIFYKDGASGNWRRIYNTTSLTYFAYQSPGGAPYWNQFTGGAWQLTASNNNHYSAWWILATNNVLAPVVVVMGQGSPDNSQTVAMSNNDINDLDLGEFGAQEFKVLYRVMVQNSGSPYTTATITDYRTAQSVGGTTNTVNDHGALNGLGDNDHPQYLLRTEIVAGTNSIANDSTSVVVTFAVAQPDTNYSITGSFVNIVDPNVLDLTYKITSKLTTGFTATFNDTTDSANYSLDWIIKHH